MAHVRIEFDRGMGWETRQEGDVDLAPIGGMDGLPAYVAGYATRWPHRAIIDDAVVTEAQTKRRRRTGAR